MSIEHNLEDFIKLPIKIKNTGKIPSAFAARLFRYFGSHGYLLENINNLSFDDANDMFTALNPGKTIDANVYMLYDGEYVLEFSNYGFFLHEVNLDIKK